MARLSQARCLQHICMMRKPPMLHMICQTDYLHHDPGCWIDADNGDNQGSMLLLLQVTAATTCTAWICASTIQSQE
jgi:hypothetical protein